MKRLLSFLFITALFVPAFANGAIDLDAVEKELGGAGVRGRIHGAAHDLRQYVFVYRDPKDFFTSVQFTLVPNDPAVAAELKKVGRHDEVVIHGTFMENPSEQKHVLLEKITTVSTFDPGIKVPARTREAKLPDDLVGKTSLLATVHAVEADGAVLVLEYKDAILPLFPENTTHTKGLYRGDKIKLHYTIQKRPRMPVHLNLSETAKPPIEVLEHIKDVHDKDLVLEGPLVFFPKSPQLKFGVFAVRIVDKDGLTLNYTLINFDKDGIKFEEIRQKLEKAWKAQEATAEDGRNCFVNPKIRIRATGKGHVISPSQANPQILLDGPDSIEILP